MKRLIIYYNFIIATTFVLLALFNVSTMPELIAGTLYSPLLLYFTLLVIPRKNSGGRIEKSTISYPTSVETKLSKINLPKNFDIDRRLFLKLIASGGVSLFLFAIFTRKAEQAFFGAGKTTGFTSLTDSYGTKIDPAEKHPTDGYQISEIDDSDTTYYGYINKNGGWFIRKEDANGSFRYTKAPSNFHANWTNREILHYGYFNEVFKAK